MIQNKHFFNRAMTTEFIYAANVVKEIKNIEKQVESATSTSEKITLENKIEQLRLIIKNVTIDYYDNGCVKEEVWIKDDKDKYLYYRPGGAPALIGYFKDGRLKHEAWFVDGYLHSTGGAPAIIEYFENGQIQEEAWYKNGRLHRPDGAPVVITYFESGEIKEERWD